MHFSHARWQGERMTRKQVEHVHTMSARCGRVRVLLQDTMLAYDAETMRYRILSQDERLLLWMYTMNVRTKESFPPISDATQGNVQDLCPLCHQRTAHAFIEHATNHACQEHHACATCLSTWLGMGCHSDCPFCREPFRPDAITLCSIRSKT